MMVYAVDKPYVTITYTLETYAMYLIISCLDTYLIINEENMFLEFTLNNMWQLRTK